MSFLSTRDLLGATELAKLCRLSSLDAEFFADERSAGQHGDVTEHGLAAITKARSFDSTNIEDVAEA